MSKSSTNKYISVFIPTYNGEKYLHECVVAILSQQLPAGYGLELLVIDSGSHDRSVEILKSFGDRLTLVEIPNSQFSHGGTRDKAARMAKGEFVLFLSQDATPMTDRWIINMIEPFFVSDKVGCVFGRQVPRPDAAATIKREVASVFGGLGAPDAIVIHRHKSLVDEANVNDLNTFFSDVNSAARRELLVGAVPFRHVNYAEDQALAEDMQNHGYLKAYAPQGAVWHSNEYTFRQYLDRKFDEYIGLQESIGFEQKPHLRSVLLGWVRPSLADWRFIRRDHEYSWWSKCVWFIESPLYNFAGKLGMYRALKYYRDQKRRDKYSLEKKARD